MSKGEEKEKKKKKKEEFPPSPLLFLFPLLFIRHFSFLLLFLRPATTPPLSHCRWIVSAAHTHTEAPLFVLSLSSSSHHHPFSPLLPSSLYPLDWRVFRFYQAPSPVYRPLLHKQPR